MSYINQLIVSVTELMPKSVVGFFSRRYIAGEKMEDAVRVVKDLNSRGIHATMDVLGESVNNKEEAVEAKNKALKVYDAIVEHKLLSNLSVKPTQMGLDIDEEFAYQQHLELVKRAKEINNFLRIDMEDSQHTDATIKLYKRLKEEYDNVGIVVQAYLKELMMML